MKEDSIALQRPTKLPHELQKIGLSLEGSPGMRKYATASACLSQSSRRSVYFEQRFGNRNVSLRVGISCHMSQPIPQIGQSKGDFIAIPTCL